MHGTDHNLLVLDRVGRRLAGREIVQDLRLTLDRGTVLGLLGVNGAGKSTTLAMIAGVLAPSRGAVRIDGRDLAEHPQTARTHVGYLPEQVPLYPELTVAEYLDACARLRGMAAATRRTAVAAALARLDLGAVARRLCGALSLGLRQRVGLAQALLHDPPLLVLDEPGNGLDPVQTASLRVLIRELGRERAVILSTHLLPEVTAVCDRVAILHEGRLRHDAPLGDGSALERTFLAIAAGAVAA